MKKIINSVLLLVVITITVNACTNNPAPAEKTQQPNAEKVETIKDPNQPKPMALMMRQMAAQADTMKAKLLRGESLDSLSFPFIRFYLVEPTDKNVLEPQFFKNADVYKQAHRNVFDNPNEQVKYYNLMINACISCHENYCSGPLRRIRKMPINN